ncbi:MAG TPA: SRPBCC family protein [Gemmatimonadaceae bacterium]|nr:SRPBCC family protein [Gemmatimonadaceae bacterium]
MPAPTHVRSALLLLLATTPIASRRERVPVQPITTQMSVYRAEVVHVSILATPGQVFDFLANVNNWKTWAPWVRSVAKSSAGDWTVDTDGGPMHLRFVEANSLGVLDHTVTLASGVRIYNAMRVSPNASGSELSMVVLQTPPATSAQFEQDVQAVRDDFGRIKRVVEAVAKDERR